MNKYSVRLKKGKMKAFIQVHEDTLRECKRSLVTDGFEILSTKLLPVMPLRAPREVV